MYALTKERDALKRGNEKLSDFSALIKEKDGIIKQVSKQGTSSRAAAALSLARRRRRRRRAACVQRVAARAPEGLCCVSRCAGVWACVQVMDEGERLSARQGELEGSIKKLRAQVRDLEAERDK